jgi:hypothetical protein
MIPTNAIPTQIQPRTRRTVLSARLRTTVMKLDHTLDCFRQRVGSRVVTWTTG